MIQIPEILKMIWLRLGLFPLAFPNLEIQSIRVQNLPFPPHPQKIGGKLLQADNPELQHLLLQLFMFFFSTFALATFPVDPSRHDPKGKEIGISSSTSWFLQLTMVVWVESLGDMCTVGSIHFNYKSTIGWKHRCKESPWFLSYQKKVVQWKNSTPKRYPILLAEDMDF